MHLNMKIIYSAKKKNMKLYGCLYTCTNTHNSTRSVTYEVWFVYLYVHMLTMWHVPDVADGPPQLKIYGFAGN